MHFFKHARFAWLPMVVTVFFLGAGDLAAQEKRPITPGQFHALTVPEKMLRVRANTDYYSEAYSYGGRDRSGEYRDFEASDFYDINASVEFRYGLTDNFEIGLGLPFVYSRLEKNGADRSSLPSKNESSGLGNITLHGGYGFAWNDDSDYLLFQVDLGLPTDSRDHHLFTFGGSLTAGLEYEHYWDRIGVTAGFLAESYADKDFDFEDWDYIGIAGLNFDVTDSLFVGVRVGFSDDRTNLEVFGEHLLTHRSSIEVFGGGDVSGDEDAQFIGVSFNVLFGNGE